MLPIFAIPIVETTTAASSGFFDSAFFARPIDVVMFDFFLWFGWIPLASTVVWGFIQMWLNYRQGKYSASLKFVLLAVDVPSMTEQTPKALENLFSNLYGCKSSITWKERWIGGRFHPSFSFEIISTEGYIQFLIRTQKRFRDIVEAGIYAHYPDAEITEVEDYTKHFPRQFPDAEYDMWGGELTLAGPSYHPIRTYVDFEDSMTQEIKDPLGYTLEQLAKMRPGEHFWIQFIVQPSTNDWIIDGTKRINEIYGIAEKKNQSFIERVLITTLDIPSGVLKEISTFDLLGTLFGAAGGKEEDPFKAFKLSVRDIEEAKAIMRKTSKVGFGVKTRILYVARKNVYVKVERTGMVKGILNQFTNLNLNKFELFIPQVPKDDYFWMRWEYTKKQETLMKGYCNRSFGVGAHPKFLNTEELATLWHFPAISIKAPLIKKAESRRAEPPVGLPFTFEENILPSYGQDTVPQLPTIPSGTRDMLMPPGKPTGTWNAFGQPPAGLPGGESLPEYLPRPIPPTQSIASASVQEVGPSPDSVQTQTDLMPPEGLLPHIQPPTQRKDGDDDNAFAPPNLPV